MPTKIKNARFAKDIMHRNPICVAQAASVQELAEVLEGNGISGAPVVDGQGRLIGVVSKSDIISRCIEGPLGTRPDSFFSALSGGPSRGDGLDPDDLGAVEEFMTTDPVTAKPGDHVVDIAHRMADERVHRIVIIDDSRTPVGIVTTLDLLAVFPRA